MKKTSSSSIFTIEDIVLYYPVLVQRNNGLSIEKGSSWNIREKAFSRAENLKEHFILVQVLRGTFLFHIIKSVKISAFLCLK